MKRFIKGFLLLLVTLAVAPKMDVKAATYSDVINDGGNWIANNYVVKEHGSTRKYQQMNIITRRSDGHFVYCVQPGVPIQEKTVTGYDSDWAIVSNMTQAQWNRVSQLAYYGYGYQDANHNHTDIKWYVITQFMIWHSVPTEYDIYFTDTLNGNRITKYTSEMQEMENLLAQHHKVPSFNQTNTSMFIGETKSFNDSNSVLSNGYIVKSFDGGSASINGNSLNITANKVGKFDVILAKNNNRYGIAPIIYVDPTSQNVFSRGDVDPTYAKLNVEIKGGTITPHKTDADTMEQKPQGEATLEGAVYEIYRESDNLMVGTVTTDKEGNATSDYLPSLGRFYLKEKKPSTGYELDSTKYYFEITTDNLFPEIDVYERVISLTFDITKVYANEKTGIMTPEPNVKFGFYNNKGELVKEATTGANGNIKVKLPYGTYTAKQLTSTQDHEKVKDFTLEVKESGDDVKMVISNAEITAKLRVVKIDAETKEVIARSHIKFKIFDVKNNDYVCQTITYPNKQTICEWETDDNGEFVTAYPLHSGTYRLEEVDQKVDGYLWNKVSHEFTIGENADLRTDSEYGIIFDTEFENHPVKGEVNIIKTGEVAILTEDGFEFKSQSLEGVKFGLFAAEDIKWNGKVVIKKGTKVAEKLTDKDGNIKFDKLVLGKYYIQEIETLDNYVLDENKYEFELQYKDQYTPVIVYSKAILNILKTGKLEFTKTDFSESKTLPNTTIEIYTENNELVFSGKTDKDGKIVIDRLPQGKYYIVEKEAPEGYKLNEEKMPFEVKENGEVIKATMKDEDITGKLEFTKVDFSTDEPLPNTLIEIYNAETDELVFSGRTDDKGMIVIDKIKYGKYYILEKEAPEGYQLNTEKMYFEITEDGQIIKSVMKDEQIVEVPNTDKTDTKELIVGGVILILIGAGAIVYGSKKRKK